jgi:hypothetical protein
VGRYANFDVEHKRVVGVKRVRQMKTDTKVVGMGGRRGIKKFDGTDLEHRAIEMGHTSATVSAGQ